MCAVVSPYEMLIFPYWQFGDFGLLKFILQYMPKWVYNDNTFLCMNSHLSKGNVLWSSHTSAKTNYNFSSCNTPVRHGDG